MGKFSSKSARPNVSAPVKTVGESLTHEGGRGYLRDPKSELFLLAVANMVKENTFYESASSRDRRYADLIHIVTKQDPDWIRGFVPYLRNTMQMRSASVVMAAEYAAANGPEPRRVIDSALSRADEPGELLAYWSQVYGRNFPMPVKRGVADAVKRLYTEQAAMKYDGTAKAWRMGDVIELVHPGNRGEWQGALYQYLLDVRHQPQYEDPREPDPNEYPLSELRRIASFRDWVKRGSPLDDELPELVTWETLSTYHTMDAEAWHRVIPNMGYMALLRNLRNFDEAGISATARRNVLTKLRDPEQVAKSRQFPIRFLSAWKATGSMHWGSALEEALELSVHNVPHLRGRTLILVDVSGSMNYGMSGRSTVQNWELAGLFGAALAKDNDADLYAYSNGHHKFNVGRGDSVLRTMNKLSTWSGAGGGTNTFGTVAATFKGQDRIVILTDEQHQWSYAQPYVEDIDVPIYTFNVMGYRAGHLPSGTKGRYSFGGLTDASFRMIEALDTLRSQGWPWESK